MAINTIPGGGGASISIEGRPWEHENTIDRQGQLVRLIQAYKCPCIKNGKADLYCNLCKGRGYLLSMQRTLEIREENSPHPGGNMIYPWYHPIAKVKKVQRWLHEINGGNVFYEVDTFDATSIRLVDNGQLPKRIEPIKVTYEVSNADIVLAENSLHDGTYTIHTKGTEIDTSLKTSNPKGIHGDIVEVNRVYNVTQDITYDVIRFAKQSIYIGGGTTIPPVPPATEPTITPYPAPLSTDVLEVDYKYVKAFRVVFTRINVENAVTKFFEDVKMGDIKMTYKARYNIGRGDIVTLQSSLLKEQQIVTRGQGNIDALPAFDITEVLEDIIDEDGNRYDSSLFEIQEYNDLYWKTVTRPATGKKYSIMYLYRPSYIVYRQMPSPMNAGDRDYPQSVFLRYLTRFTHKDLEMYQQ